MVSLPIRFHGEKLRQGRVSIPENVYTITKCQNRNSIKLLTDYSGLPEAIIDSLLFCQKQSWCRLAAFIVMPNHIHFIIKLQDKGLSEIVKSVCSFSYKYAREICGQSSSLWQHSFFDHAIRRDENMAIQIEYVENNPVRGGLVALAEDWKYSSINANYRSKIDRSWLFG